ncbi:MAG TPA: FAD/NAD(P)-binding protein [Myxococcota bacterium]|nr:FAD/NAD(P)-binding protein [Myxococcota bacterium]
MLDWLIVGGGPHGVHLALRLRTEAAVAAADLRILDDQPRLLERWRRCSRNTGMRYLRSPAVHHIDVSAGSLQRFAHVRRSRLSRPFTRPYNRPSLELFDRHCRAVIERHALTDLHACDRALRIEPLAQGLRVHLANGAPIETRQLVLALGAPRKPTWPSWARALAEEARETLDHVFDPGFDLSESPAWRHVVVVGAGISGAQTALRLASAGRKVSLVTRGALRVEQFDSDPGWQGPMHMNGFAREPDPDARREMIRVARHRGSMPPEIHRALRQAIRDGRIDLHPAEVEGARPCSRSNDGRIVLVTSTGRLIADHVLLTTGHATHRPGGEMVDELVETLGLPCAACDYPIIDRALRWHPRIFVSGPLAELEIGPVSRNLSGAQRAGDRIVRWARAAADSPSATRRRALAS